MASRALLVLLLCGVLPAAKKPQPIADGLAGNADVLVNATVYADPGEIQQLLGSDLDGHYIVINLELTPKPKFVIDHDNFLLKTDKDGEKSHPFEPTQIAGDGVLVVSPTGIDGSDVKQGKRGPVFSGGFGGMGAGTGSAQATGSKGTMHAATGQRNPVLDVLESKILPQKEIDQPTVGLLYFPMEKQKVKDLELIVTTPTGKLSIRFKK
jgi:hypothetical protein